MTEPEKIWYYRLKDKNGENSNLMRGPISIGELLSLGKVGEVGKNTLVRAGLSGPWIRFSAFQERQLSGFQKNLLFVIAAMAVIGFVILSFTDSFLGASGRSSNAGRKTGLQTCESADDVYGPQLESSEREAEEKDRENKEFLKKLQDEQKFIYKTKALPSSKRPDDFEERLKKYNSDLKWYNVVALPEKRKRDKDLALLKKNYKEKSREFKECSE